MGIISCHGEHRLGQMCPQTFFILSHFPMILHMKFGQEWPTGIRYIHLWNCGRRTYDGQKKSKRKVQGVPQSQTAALPRPQEEEETDKSKQAQTEQTYEKH